MAIGLLAGCVPNLTTPYEAEQQLARAEWQVRPLAEAWVNSPQSRLLLERRAAGQAEQRLDLPNPTNLQGENLLHVRTVTPMRRSARLDIEEALGFLGGLPYPFTADDLSAMRSRGDAAGTLTWAEWTNGAGFTCVLAVRRLEVGVRLVPTEASALDLVMRNCVHGDSAAALLPAGPRTVAFPATPGIAEGVPLRTLSPLAAPAP